MSYKHHINQHFSSCRHLANAHDPYRNRDVKLYALPGEFSHVGVTDGVDAWIAPAAPSLFSVDVLALLNRLRLGEDIRVATSIPCVRVIARVAIRREEEPTRSHVRVQVHA